MTTKPAYIPNEELEEALRFDPLAEAERITGKSYKESADTASLGLLLTQQQGERTDALLFLNRDTRFNATLEEQLDVIKDLGFQKLAEGEIPTNVKEKPGDKWMIFWHRGVLLFLDTYFEGKTLNSGKVYLNYCGPRTALNRSSSGWAGEIEGESVWDASYDIREGLRNYLEGIEAQGTILEKWIKPPFLWLLHYADTRVEGYDHKAITAARIALLPPEVQAAINGD